MATLLLALEVNSFLPVSYVPLPARAPAATSSRESMVPSILTMAFTVGFVERTEFPVMSDRAIRRMSPVPSAVSRASSVPSTPAKASSIPEEAGIFTSVLKSSTARLFDSVAPAPMLI